jgi:hypothetical protein
MSKPGTFQIRNSFRIGQTTHLSVSTKVAQDTHNHPSIKVFIAKIKDQAENQEARVKAILEGKEVPPYHATAHDPCSGVALAKYHEFRSTKMSKDAESTPVLVSAVTESAVETANPTNETDGKRKKRL